MATKRNKRHHFDEHVEAHTCHQIAVKRLPKVTSPYHELGWWGAQKVFHRGHYPYSVCKQANAGQRAVLPVTVLMVASHAYRTVVPSWAEHVQAVGASCVLGSIGAKDTACVLAESLGCGCLRARDVDDIMDTRGEQESGAYSNGLSPKFEGPRARSVKQRFAYAVRLMENSTRSVLMHDGDVFFKRGGLSSMLALVRNVGLQDFVVSDNHFPRREVYDDLNWGFVWISGSRLTSLTLRCLLATWEHSSFNGSGSFFRRSQPRINRLLETHFEHAAESRVRLCSLPGTFARRTFTHMSKMKRARAKIICAVSEGALPKHFPSNGGVKLNVSRTLSYDVPPMASIALQRKALSAALAIALASGRALHLPRVHTNDGARVEFCSLFDVGSIPLDAALLPPEKSCRSTMVVSDAAFGRSISLATLSTHRPPTLCVQFETMLRLAKQLRKEKHGIPSIKTCMPPVTGAAPVECIDGATPTAHGHGSAAERRRLSAPSPPFSSPSLIDKAMSFWG